MLFASQQSIHIQACTRLRLYFGIDGVSSEFQAHNNMMRWYKLSRKTHIYKHRCGVFFRSEQELAFGVELLRYSDDESHTVQKYKALYHRSSLDLFFLFNFLVKYASIFDINIFVTELHYHFCVHIFSPNLSNSHILKSIQNILINFENVYFALLF